MSVGVSNVGIIGRLEGVIAARHYDDLDNDNARYQAIMAELEKESGLSLEEAYDELEEALKAGFLVIHGFQGMSVKDFVLWAAR